MGGEPPVRSRPGGVCLTGEKGFEEGSQERPFRGGGGMNGAEAARTVTTVSEVATHRRIFDTVWQ